LVWIYTAGHDYDHQGHRGRASLRWTPRLRISGPERPTYDDVRRRIRWKFDLEAHGTWRSSLSVSMEENGHTFAPHENYRPKRDEFLRTRQESGSPQRLWHTP
jgi:hypothetical protein